MGLLELIRGLEVKKEDLKCRGNEVKVGGWGIY